MRLCLLQPVIGVCACNKFIGYNSVSAGSGLQPTGHACLWRLEADSCQSPL